MQNSQFSNSTSSKKNHSCDENFTHLSNKIGASEPFLGNIAKLQAKRFERFKLQRIAKTFLKGVPKSHRFHNCLYASRDKNSTCISIMANSNQSCNYLGLQMCGSRSICICCSHRLSEISRQDILKASTKHLSNGGGFALVTYTIPHKLSDKLEDLLRLSTLARNLFNQNGSVKAIYKEIGRIGYIRSYEDKHGANGWHPHQHFLFYLKSAISEKQRISIQQRLLYYWQKACVQAGLARPNQHGLDFLSCTDPLKASEYIVKDSFEIASANTKLSKTGSINPFELLSHEPYQYGSRKRLFREYYLATKGKARIYWSRGLKAMFSINTKDDDEGAINDYNDAEYTIPVVDLCIFDWNLIRKYDLRAELLEFTENYISSQDLISIPNYDHYINLFYQVYNLNINEKKSLEPPPAYVFNDVDLLIDPYILKENYMQNKKYSYIRFNSVRL